MTAEMPEKRLPGLYIHVPFCKTKCPYCDFYSVTDLSCVAGWLDALEKEMDAYRDVFSSFDSLYLGGGTPSLLDAETVGRLMAAVKDRWRLAPDAEITLEMNPDDVTGEKLLALRMLGINRLSLGVQSFEDSELSFLKRRHTSAGAHTALELVRSSEPDNFGIDLMYGLKGQRIDTWLKTLERAVSYGPAHLSCYQLTVEKHTPFGKLREAGTLRPLTERTGRKFFLETSRFLERLGFIHYEISNFARTEGLMSRHNRKYWDHTPYLGLGPAAHSFAGKRRWWNHRSVEEYCACLAGGTKPVQGFETLTPEQERLERLYLGLRTREGFSLSDLGPYGPSSKTLLHLQESHLISIVGERVIPTTEGFLVSDRLPLLLWEDEG
jgi:oxygen-independent coproporphyrinogen III oxidase